MKPSGLNTRQRSRLCKWLDLDKSKCTEYKLYEMNNKKLHKHQLIRQTDRKKPNRHLLARHVVLSMSKVFKVVILAVAFQEYFVIHWLRDRTIKRKPEKKDLKKKISPPLTLTVVVIDFFGNFTFSHK